VPDELDDAALVEERVLAIVTLVVDETIFNPRFRTPVRAAGSRAFRTRTR